MKLEEIEKIIGAGPGIGFEKYLLSLVKRYREGIGHIKELGHNDNCLMCAMKDTLVKKLLDEPEGGKGLSRPLFF